MDINKWSEPSEMTQELRLATTLTGGVSLAIWMAGVAREINLLAQASQWRRVGGGYKSGTLSEPAEKSLELYRGLIELLDTVVDVDILSGTSAGGINGALLAWSRVRGSDLGKLREIWMGLGALTDLLREPTDKDTPSLLYGDARMLRDLVAKIPELDDGPFPTVKSEEPSTTLYITTTLLHGETSRFTDAFGTLVQDVDRRGIFTFTEKDLAKKGNKLAEAQTVQALALAARSSASFPAAFEPSFVPFKKPIPKNGEVPARPPMEGFANITRSHWVADGGLLDNQPIDVVLKRIFDRPAERPVRRVLLFVVPSSGPSPDLTEEPPADDVDKPLGLVKGLMKDLSAITTQSIAADLRAIRAHQDRMEARTDARLRLAELAVDLGTSPLLTRKLLADYLRREATKQAQELTTALLRQLSTWPPESTKSTESIPKKWESELAVGGDAEKVCRQSITDSILKRWTPLPELPELPELPKSLEDLARYGQAAFDLGKACAISIVAPAYRLARSKGDFEFLAILTKAIHGAQHPPPAPVDIAQVVRDVCTVDAKRNSPLAEAAAQIAEEYLGKSEPVEAWGQLGMVFVGGFNTLDGLAESDRDPSAAGQLRTYLKYLGSQGNLLFMATKLFDLAAAQRAMLPAGADIDQSVELVQVSADTRSLLAPKFQTAQDKLTGMQLHHFGAFYKRSWRANDWMWGRLDGAGWLVHVLLDPRRVRSIVERRQEERNPGETGAEWFLRELEKFGAPESDDPNTDDLLLELAFLDDTSTPPPSSIPKTSLWLAQVWQQRVLNDELTVLARTVVDPQSQKPTDWSPPESMEWAEKVWAANRAIDETKQKAENAKQKVKEMAAAAAHHADRPAADQAQAAKNAKEAAQESERAAAEVEKAVENYYRQLNGNAVAKETFASDKGSPLMARTLTKAAATASAAIGSVQQLPSVVKPPLITLQTLTLGGYRVVSVTKGYAKWSIFIGVALLVLGIAFAIQSAGWAGLSGLTMIAVGGYLVVLATWQLSSRVIFAALSLAIVLLAIAPSIKCVATWLFGEKESQDSGFVGKHLYWLSTDWTHPLIVELVFIGAVIVLGIAYPDRWRISRLLRRLRKCWQRLVDRVRPAKTTQPQEVSSPITDASVA
jgi:predicted acylesterase/phospholipase RssA